MRNLKLTLKKREVTHLMEESDIIRVSKRFFSQWCGKHILEEKERKQGNRRCTLKFGVYFGDRSVKVC